MRNAMRRGACPSLSAPMETGDGLLVRLSPASGVVSPCQLDGVARAAARHGNGLLEVTRRGNLQVRGLTPQSTGPLANDIAALDIAVLPGIPVETGPLAGLAADEIADPRPIADDIRARAYPLAARLGPKVSVTVDGGGRLHLGAVLADVKLTASAGGWQLAIGGNAGSARKIGVFDAAQAVDKALDMLEMVAAQGRSARARDLAPPALVTALPPNIEQPSPVGSFPLKDGTQAQGFALAFGQIDARSLGDFAGALEENALVRLAPSGGLIVTGISAGEAARLRVVAGRLGIVTQPGDARLSIVACAGAPACRSAFFATRALAAELAARGAPGRLVHLSGCAKGCARPAAPSVTLTGTPLGCVVDDAAEPVLRDTLFALASRHFVHREHA